MKKYNLNKWFCTNIALFISVVNGLLLISNSVLAGESNLLKINNLRCENLSDLQSLDRQFPGFGWVLESKERGQKQTAYQIIVTDSEGNLMWNSEKIDSSESSYVKYAGKLLKSSSDYYWKVRVWDKDDKPGKYTTRAHFATAFMDQKDWKAHWIGRGPLKEPVVRWGTNYETADLELIKDMEPDYQSTLLRKEVVLNKQVKSAKIHVCGLGLYELYINGSKIGKTREHVPLKTDYSKQVLYNSYDITNTLGKGSNVIGIMLGNGWFNPQKKYWDWRMQWWGSPKAIVQVEITYKGGSTATIISDQSWKTSPGPVLNSCIYDGEEYDATLEQEGWDKKGFNDADWKNANLVQAPAGKLVAQLAPSITVVETIEPKSVKEVKPGVFVFDMGQNFAGWARISCKGNRGTKIQLRHAENINEDGTLNIETLGYAKNTDTYVLKGGGSTEVYEPHFTSHGFQYLEVTGYPGKPAVEDVIGCVANSDCPTIGNFECSNELVNHIYHCTFWTHRSLMQGLPVDCVQRGERLGWGADAMLMAEGTIYNFDASQFYAKWFADLELHRDGETGNLPIISPWNGSMESYPAWSSAYVIMNWYSYLYYGDKQLLARHYDNMKSYVDYLQTKSSGNIQPRDGSGDWKSLAVAVRGGPLLISTAFYYYDAKVVAESAKALGKTKDAEKYGQLAEEIAQAFNNVFQTNKRIGFKYGENTQCESAAPLFLGIAPENTQSTVVKNLIDDIEAHDVHLTTGFYGVKWVMEALPVYGRADIAYQLLTQKTYPSWGDMTKGRTTVSETWEGTGTNNHGGLGGAPNPWIFKTLLGINPDPENPGFKRIIINPYIPDDMTYAKGSTRTIKGLVESSWVKENGKVVLTVSIPANTTALICLPCADPANVEEGNNNAGMAPGVSYLGVENNKVNYEIESGQYQFIFNDINEN
ncbi:MAG: family 78 glycoside hydrolase catalytic domain [Draconibacterium sp.]